MDWTDKSPFAYAVVVGFALMRERKKRPKGPKNVSAMRPSATAHLKLHRTPAPPQPTLSPSTEPATATAMTRDPTERVDAVRPDVTSRDTAALRLRGGGGSFFGLRTGGRSVHSAQTTSDPKPLHSILSSILDNTLDARPGLNAVIGDWSIVSQYMEVRACSHRFVCYNCLRITTEYFRSGRLQSVTWSRRTTVRDPARPFPPLITLLVR